jgi:energy-coupling factor transport system ATP-binding protein
MSVGISIEHLTHIYNPRTPTARTALHDITMQIEAASCTAIVGVTGSGKTTLVQHFNGLLKPTEGSVRVGDIEVTSDRTRSADLRKLRRRVGLLFQFPEAQLFAPTIYDDVAFGPRQLGLAEAVIRMRVIRALDAVALDTSSEFLQRSPFALSGGQRRRVALAGVLAMRPQVLVLDEPSAGLDAEARNELYARLAELRANDGLTLVFISHDMAEVAALADRVFVMAGGELRLSGAPEDLFRQPDDLIACGLVPPPLAQVTRLAQEHGWPAQPQHFTPEQVATALAAGISSASHSSLSQAASGSPLPRTGEGPGVGASNHNHHMQGGADAE